VNPAVPVSERGGDPALDELQYAVVDVETTGGSASRGHRVTEVAAYRIDRSGTFLDEVRSLVDPDRPIPRSVSRLTGITNAMVADAPRFAEVTPGLQRVMANAVFVAHNAAFDQSFIREELRRADLAGAAGRTLCTVRMARRLVPEIRSNSLDALIHFFGVPCEARHRAWADARATVDVFLELLDRAESSDLRTWSELETFLARRKERPRRSALPRSMDWPEWA